MKLEITYAGPRQLTPQQKLAADQAWIACLQNGVRAAVNKIDPAHILDIKELPGFNPETREAGAHAKLEAIGPKENRTPAVVTAGVVKVTKALLISGEQGHVRIDWDNVDCKTYGSNPAAGEAIVMPVPGSVPPIEVDFTVHGGTPAITGTDGVDEPQVRKLLSE